MERALTLIVVICGTFLVEHRVEAETTEQPPPVESASPETAEQTPVEAASPETAEQAPIVEAASPETAEQATVEAASPETAEQATVEAASPETAEQAPVVEAASPETAEQATVEASPETAEQAPVVEAASPETAEQATVEASPEWSQEEEESSERADGERPGFGMWVGGLVTGILGFGTGIAGMALIFSEDCASESCPQWIAMAAIGVTAFVIGIILVTLGRRRMRRSGVAPDFMSSEAALTFQALAEPWALSRL